MCTSKVPLEFHANSRIPSQKFRDFFRHTSSDSCRNSLWGSFSDSFVDSPGDDSVGFSCDSYTHICKEFFFSEAPLLFFFLLRPAILSMTPLAIQFAIERFCKTWQRTLRIVIGIVLVIIERLA